MTASAQGTSDASGSQAAPAGRAIVVGASSGIGRALTRQLVEEGWAVLALARRAELLDDLRSELAAAQPGAEQRLRVQAHDVADVEAVPGLFDDGVERLGGLDLIVYGAAVMPEVAPDEFDTAKDLTMLQVNLAGCVAWCNPAATYFRTRRAGSICGISSIAGDRGRRKGPVYGTTKAGMNHYLEALRNRLDPFGVHVCTIRPGFVDTDMTRGMDGLLWLVSADEAARKIRRALRKRAQVAYVPGRWRLVGTVIRSIPSVLFRRMDI